MALRARQTVHLAGAGLQRGVFRIDFALRMFAQVSGECGDFRVGGRGDAGHHVFHQRAHIALAPHAPHHAFDHGLPARCGAHLWTGQMVALHAVTRHQPRTVGMGFRQLLRLNGRQQDAFEHAAMGTLRPQLSGLRGFRRFGGMAWHGSQPAATRPTAEYGDR